MSSPIMATAGVADSRRRMANLSSSITTTATVTATTAAASDRRYVKQSSLYGVADPTGSHEYGDGHTTFLRPLFGQVARFAYGCVMMEVWVYDAEAGRLNRCAWWVDHDFAMSHNCSEHGKECKQGCCLDKLIDEDCPGYVKAKPLAAGVGLAGTLWSEVEEFHASLQHQEHGHEDQNSRPSLLGGLVGKSNRKSDPSPINPNTIDLSKHGSRSYRSTLKLNVLGGGFRKSRALDILGISRHTTPQFKIDGKDNGSVGRSGNRTKFSIATKAQGESGVEENHVDVDDYEEEDKVVVSSRRIHWRNVEHLACDPDQPYDERLRLLNQVGIGWAGAVPFHMAGHEGIVIYSTTKDAHLDRLKQPSNELYLRRSTDLIGAAFAIQAPLEIVSKHYDGGAMSDLTGETDSMGSVTEREELEAQKELDESDRRKGFSNEAKSHVLQMLHKYKGAGVKAPPSMIWEEALLTTVGVFFTILMLASLSVHLPEQGLIMGSFGAFTTLLFGLTAAPASQPRNAFWGQLISGVIGMAVSYLPWAVYVRQALATALAIGTMVKMGITHPPAGGAAIMLANGQWSWLTLPFMLVAVCIAVCSATFFNNLSQKRQYPTSWGLQPLHDIYSYVIDSGHRDDEVPATRPSHKLLLAKAMEKAESKRIFFSNEDVDSFGGDEVPGKIGSVDSCYSAEVEV